MPSFSIEQVLNKWFKSTFTPNKTPPVINKWKYDVLKLLFIFSIIPISVWYRFHCIQTDFFTFCNHHLYCKITTYSNTPMYTVFAFKCTSNIIKMLSRKIIKQTSSFYNQWILKYYLTETINFWMYIHKDIFRLTVHHSSGHKTYLSLWLVDNMDWQIEKQLLIPIQFQEQT